MPIPIKPISEQSKYTETNFQVDYSMLINIVPDIKAVSDKKIITASDSDAKNLMEIWEKAEKESDGSFKINKDIKVSYRDIMRLKTNGLLIGTNENVKFTDKAKTVIRTMVLGENNNFLKNQKQKSYTEIMASMDKRGKKGYRLTSLTSGPRFASNTLIRTISQVKDIDDFEKLEILSCITVRDGGSQKIKFSDGFSCVYDNGINSVTRGKFVKDFKDRTVIDVPEKYKELLKKDSRFGHAENI